MPNTESTSTWTQMLGQMEQEIQQRIDDAVSGARSDVDTIIEQLRTEVRDNTASLDVKVAGKINRVEGARHNQLDDLIAVAAQHLPVLLVGMAGTGKTHAAEQVSESLGLKFHAMSVGGQTSKSDIMGFMHAGGEYVPTMFRRAFEDGGVFLMDEIDAGNANVMIQVNAALSNGYCAFPDAMVKRHPDFTFIASANTFGNGANRQYVGRNQLDAATLDRFVILEWNIDDRLEALLAGDTKDAKSWHKAVTSVRSAVTKEGMRVLVTPRATLRGSTLLAAGLPMDVAAELSLYNLFPADKQAWARKIGNQAMGRKLP